MLHSFIKTTKTRCTALSVWNVVKDRLCFRGSLCCFPKASAKVQLFFLPPNFFATFFKKFFSARKTQKNVTQNVKVARILNTPLSAESGYKVTAKN